MSAKRCHRARQRQQGIERVLAEQEGARTKLEALNMLHSPIEIARGMIVITGRPDHFCNPAGGHARDARVAS